VNEPWPSIVARYAQYRGDSPSIHAVGELASHIARGPLAEALYGWTSMFALCVTQQEVTYPYAGPLLRVSPQLDGQVEFRYLDSPNHEQQWVRAEPADEVVARLHSFLRQLRWVSESTLRE
jgi:hypothetical protein